MGDAPVPDFGCHYHAVPSGVERRFFVQNQYRVSAWPQGLAWDNYVRAYEKSNLAANIGNSIYVVLETLVIIVICVVPCSYCLVRYKFPGAKLILNIYMAAIFRPLIL